MGIWFETERAGFLTHRMVAQQTSIANAGMLTAVDNSPTIHQDIADAGRITAGLLVRPHIGNGVWIKDHNIGIGPSTDEATIREMEFLGGQTRHLMNGIRQSEQPCFADIFS